MLGKIGERRKRDAFERAVKVPVTKIMRIAVDECRSLPICVVDVVPMTATIAILTVMPVVAVVIGMRLAHIVTAMYVRMISSLVAMIDHGSERNLHLTSRFVQA